MDYGGASATCTAASGAFTCSFTASVLAASNSGSGVSDSSSPGITVTANVDDAAGNSATGASVSITQDTADPTMAITSATVVSGASTTTAAIALTFTSNEATSDFAQADITESGCTLGTFGTTSSLIYTDTCTASSDGTPTVSVAAGAFNDAVGNLSLIHI